MNAITLYTAWTCNRIYSATGCLMREWGRIGSSGQIGALLFSSPHETQAALEKQRRMN